MGSRYSVRIVVDHAVISGLDINEVSNHFLHIRP
jgi:hypothetical protein